VNSNRKLSLAIATILSGGGAGFALAAPPASAPAETGTIDTIQEIVVTAQRRSENMQDVPIQIQALTGQVLTQLNVTTFDDFVKYLPNVTSASNGPGQGVIFMRGLATSTLATQGSSGIGSFPNVAVYLDDQSGQLPGRNLDVYAADIERIEVLEGPQGTLFGAGAQAGVLRYITNKPKLDLTEGAVNAGYATTAGGDPSSSVDAMINLPLIPDKLAVRAVIYDEKRGGYINNVPGTFSRLPTDIGIHYGGYPTGCGAAPAPPCTVPPGSPSASNGALVGDAFNPTTYKGIRVGAYFKFNEDWNALLVQSYQNMNSQGVFYVTPQSSAGETLPDLGVQIYNPSYNLDRFENTSLTVNGKLGDLKLVYSGSYMVRNIDQQGDYTNYARGVYADYYQCTNPAAYHGGPVSKCYSPSSYWHETDTATHNSQEFRVSTPDEWRVRGIAGIFWESYKIAENIDWSYKTLPSCMTAVDVGCLTNVAPAPGADVRNQAIRPDNVSFFDDVTRGYTQKAAFGSIDFDIIPKMLTVTFGTRYYRINTTAVGSSVSSFGCMGGGPPPCTGNVGFSNNLSAQNLDITYKGFKSRANISFRPIEDVLIYYTWSQGFRPGGFNRGSHLIDHSVGSFTGPVNGFAYQYQTPSAYAPDTLVNNELGWKTQWFDKRLEFNGAVYQEDWKDVQVQIFQSCCYGNLSFVINGPNYRVRGLETEIVARVTHELTVTGSASWNSSNLTNAPILLSPTGQGIVIPGIGSPFGEQGSPLAQSPAFQASLRARYDGEFGDFKWFVQAAGTHQAHSYSATGSIQAYDQAGFSTYDASTGLSKDAWGLQLYVQNLSNTRANLFENGNQFVTAETINRPRTAGMRFSYKF